MWPFSPSDVPACVHATHILVDPTRVFVGSFVGKGCVPMPDTSNLRVSRVFVGSFMGKGFVVEREGVLDVRLIAASRLASQMVG